MARLLRKSLFSHWEDGQQRFPGVHSGATESPACQAPNLSNGPKSGKLFFSQRVADFWPGTALLQGAFREEGKPNVVQEARHLPRQTRFRPHPRTQWGGKSGGRPPAALCHSKACGHPPTL